jgi:plasmid stability protein
MSNAIIPKTKNLLIRDLDPALHGLLKARAHANHRSMSEEAREALRGAMASSNSMMPTENLYQIARRIFGEKRGFDLDLPPRGDDIERPPVDFSGPEYNR